jgi:hypothetical protein
LGIFHSQNAQNTQLLCTSFHQHITIKANNMNANNANNNAVYAFAIPASEPVANAAAALYVMDAPGIEANQPIVAEDMIANICEVDSRKRLMLSPPELSPITSGEVALSVS